MAKRYWPMGEAFTFPASVVMNLRVFTLRALVQWQRVKFK